MDEVVHPTDTTAWVRVAPVPAPSSHDGDDGETRRCAHVRPVAWQMPVPHPYDLVVVGGGIDDATDGFVAMHHQRGRLRGSTIVAPHAGEMIGEAAYALAHGGTLGALSDTIHPYPTFAERFRKAGDQYRRQALTPRIHRLLTRYFDLTR